MNMSTSSLILYRTFQVLGFILAIFKIFAPFYSTLSALAHCPQSGKAAETHGGSQDRAQVAFRDAQGEPHPLQDDPGICGGEHRRQPTGGVQMGKKGTSEPNTSNLMALAKLYGIPAEDLLRGVESALEEQKKIITRCASPPYRPRTVWGSGSCGLFRCGAL